METKKTKPKTVSEYIASAPKSVQTRLRAVRACMKKNAPKGMESLKWGMPSISYARILVTYAWFKNHIGLYPTPSAVREFKKELVKYKTAMGSIQFPHDKPLPLPLIKKIVAFRAKEAREKDVKWKG